MTQISCFFFLFFSFFFYHAYIVSRYKKLRQALAMERTKPINQNKQQKKPKPLSSAFTEILPNLKPFGSCSSWKQHIRKS